MATKKSIKVTGAIKVKPYRVLEDCLERGVQFGWLHAHKHDEHPDEATIRDHIVQDILNEICEYFDFDD